MRIYVIHQIVILPSWDCQGGSVSYPLSGTCTSITNPVIVHLSIAAWIVRRTDAGNRKDDRLEPLDPPQSIDLDRVAVDSHGGFLRPSGQFANGLTVAVTVSAEELTENGIY